MRFTKSARFLLPVLPVLVFAMQALWSAAIEAFWSDEMFSYFMAGNPAVGLGGVWEAVWDGRDGMMPLFYFAHFLWGATLQPLVAEALAGTLPRAAEFAWRLPSILVAAGGCLVLGWWLARRVGAALAALVLGLALFGSPVVLAHVAGFRGYGMLFGFSLSLVVVLDWWATGGRRLVWCAAALVAAAMAMTHLMGLIFALAAIGGVSAASWPDRRKALAALMIALPAVGLTLVCLPVLIHTARLADPWSWVPVPSLIALPQGFLAVQPDQWLIPALLAGACAGLRGYMPGGASCSVHAGEASSLSAAQSAVVAAWLLLPPSLWVVSQFVTPLFLDRYFLPVSIAGGLLGAAVLHRACGWRATAVATCVLVVGNFMDIAMIRRSSAGPDASSAHARLYPRSGDDVRTDGSRSIPVSYLHVTDNLHEFLVAVFYGEEPASQWYYLFDLPSAQDRGSGEPRRLSNEIQIALAHARTWQATGGLNGLPTDRLLPLSGFRQAIEAAALRQLKIVMDRTLDQRAAKMAAAMLESAGWRRAGSEIVSPPRGSPSPAIERTLWLPPESGRSSSPIPGAQ